MYRSSLAGLGLSSLLLACTSFSDAEVTPSGGAGGSTTGAAGSAGSSPSGGQGGQAGQASGGAGSAGAAGHRAGSGGAGSGGQGGASGASSSGSSGQSGSNPGGSAQGGLGGSSGGTASGGAPSGGQAGQGGEAGLAQGGSPVAGSTGASGAGSEQGGMSQGGSTGEGGATSMGGTGQGGSPGQMCSKDQTRCEGKFFQICEAGQWVTQQDCSEIGGVCAEKGCVQTNTCGNGVLDLTEACDPLLPPPPCAQIVENTTGQTSCTISCQIDASACTACGNGKIDEGEFCDSQQIPMVTCAQLTGSEGSVSCSQCRINTSSCTVATCGYKAGLTANSPWPALGGCMRRPRTTTLAGPLMPASPLSLLAPTSPGFKGIDPTLGLNGAFVWHFDKARIARVNVSTGMIELSPMLGTSVGWVGQATLTEAANVVLTSQFLIVNPVSSSPGLIELPEPPGGDLVITPGQSGQVNYHYPSAQGIRRSQSLVSFKEVWPSPFALGGTMAYDERYDWIVAAQRDCTECQVGAFQQGMLAWVASVPGGALNHVALGADGSVYVSGGSALTMFHPQFPQKLHTFSSPGKALPVALLPDATARFAISRGSPDSPSHLVSLSPQLGTSWSVSIEGDLLSAPIADASGTTYLCTGEHVYAIDQNGAQRWMVPVKPSSTCTLAVLSAGRLTVVLDSGIYVLQ